MTVNATELLEKIGKENEEKLKSIHVEKAIDLEIDVGSLIAVDNNLLDEQALKSNTEAYIQSLARDNAQLLFNKIWKLPSEKIQDATIAQLPAPTLVLPREKHIPKPKPLTKWEEFAKLKGIKKRKKGRMEWDEESKSWKPRWGYKRAGDKTKEWVLEVPANADPNEDQFEKEMKAKKERVAKNELQRLRNIARRRGKKVPGIGETMTPDGNKSIPQLKKTFDVARQSTASLGRFDEKLKGEKTQKNRGKKRKFEALSYSSKEKQKQLDLLTNMYKNKQPLDVNRAVNQELGRSGGEVKKTKVQKGKSARKGGSKTPARKRGGKK